MHLDLMFGWHYWWLALPGLILAVYAQFKLSSAYAEFDAVPARAGWTGAEAARKILDHAGLDDIPVEEVEGHLTDHFDPTKRALFLSSNNFRGTSLAAVGVAAHEAGHALQQQAGYALFNLRMFIAPATQIATSVSYGLVLLGYIGGNRLLRPFIGIAIGVFTIITFFQMVTLPVEYDASRRAKEQLVRLGLVQADEKSAIDQVLDAAALTYVAAMITSLMTLLSLIMTRDRDRDR
jgi:Zn-dependent membrane protease YugP